MKYVQCALLFLLLSCLSVSVAAQRRVIIDTDPGVDDAFALLLALRSPDLRVEAITVVAGNVPAETGLPNALRMVEIAGRTDVPVAVGARAPLLRKLVTATYAHGENGLGGISFPDPKIKPVSEPAVDLMRRIIRSNPGQVSIIAVGPLTNLAMAIQGDRELARMIQEIVIMGGSLSGGNTTPSAEFNIYVDPEAARIVFNAGIPLTMVGLDVTRKATFTEEYVKMLEAGRDPVSQAAARLARNGMNRAKERGATTGPAMHDPLTLAAFLDKSILKLSQLYVDVETSGELTAGETVGYRRAPIRHSPPSLSEPATANVTSETFTPNASVAIDVDVEKFFRLFIGRLTGNAIGSK